MSAVHAPRRPPGRARARAAGQAARAGAAAAAPAREDRALRIDVLRAVGDAGKLGTSLLGTWAIGLAIRVYLPRHLGPSTFGSFQFADAFTSTVFIVASLGLDTYVRKEVATRREHASEFFGGTLVLRLALSVVLLLAGAVGLRLAGRDAALIHLVVILGAVQMLGNLNATYAAMLHAIGRVDGFSAWNVVAKIVWGAGIAVAVALNGGVMGVAAALIASEALKTLALGVLAQRHVGLRFRVNVPASLAVVRASLPYFTATVAQTVYSRVDVTIMSFLTTTTEVGWYGAGATLAGMSLLLSPLIGWVLLPLTSRAAARSEAELILVSRRAMETALSVAVPASLFLYLGAQPLVAFAFGPAFAPAALSLRVLAPTLLLTYVAMVSASVLVRLERGWAVSWVTISGMVLSPALNLWLVPRGLRMFGAGGAGAGAGVALVCTECYAAGALSWLIGRRGVDRRLVLVLVKTAAVCAVVMLVDALLAGLGAWRLVVDGGVYVAGVLSTRAVNLGEVTSIVRGAVAARRGVSLPSIPDVAPI